jgi:hypothetical protein
VAKYLANCEQEINTPLEEGWGHLSYSISKAAVEVLGELDKRRKPDDWFDSECSAATDAKNKAYGLMQQRGYTRSSVEAYRTARLEEE